MDSSGQHLRGDEDVVLNRHAGVGFSGGEQAGHDHHGRLEPLRTVNGHDLNGRSVGLRDGLRPLSAQFTNLNHAPIDGGGIVAGFVANGLHDGGPSFGKLALSIVRVGHQEVGVVKHGVKHVVDRSPPHQLMQASQQRPNRFGGRMIHEVRKHLASLFQRNEGVVNLLLRHAHHGGPSQLNRCFAHGGARHQRQQGHQRLNNRLHQQQTLSVGHHRDVSRPKPFHQVGQVFA